MYSPPLLVRRVQIVWDPSFSKTDWDSLKQQKRIIFEFHGIEGNMFGKIVYKSDDIFVPLPQSYLEGSDAGVDELSGSGGAVRGT
jgi:hypothetical protein